MSEATSGDRHLFELVRVLAARKRAEDEAKAARVEAEENLIAATGFAKSSGSQSYKATGEFGSAAVVLKQPTTVTVISDRLSELKKTMRRSLFSKLFKVKYSVVAKELANLERRDRDAWIEAMECLTTKPGKVGVEIKSLEVLGGDIT